jgi:hypothetical protein
MGASRGRQVTWIDQQWGQITPVSRDIAIAKPAQTFHIH